MYELKVRKSLCDGNACLICKDILPGFISKYGGEVMVSEAHRRANWESIESGLKFCPAAALSFTEIE